MNSKRLGWLFLFILAFFTSGCSLKFSLNPAETRPSGIYHTVQKSETLWRISQAYSSSVSDIKNANNLKGDEIEVGQRLLIPHATKIRKVTPNVTPQVGRPPKPAVIIKPVPKIRTEAPIFSWPISGKVISSSEDAEREKKISLEGKPEEKIRTTRSGQVFFTGKTRGYSSTIIVDHLDGFYSVYGGDIEITVRKGEILAKNGIIGNMVSTREKPTLFFEIRRGTEPMNPLNYLNK
ncbi:MAG: LysM peptidoglycan-binding domain-containing protein [Candidatus Omnitrophica bacterium]|nr:LysM peptidoglycan-binding domain-containing protein [Candidatus Omnitrophota bacterium]